MRPQTITIVTPDPKMAAQTNGNYERHAISTDREVSLSVRSYYYFSSSVALFQVFDSLREFA
jgi:hypothetical protein